MKIKDQMGIKGRNVGQNLEGSGSKLEALDFDAINNPDLVPPLEFLGCFAKGTSEIRGVKRLCYKETNRLQTIAAEFVKMCVKITVTDDSVKVRGGGLIGRELYTRNDARLSMSCATQ